MASMHNANPSRSKELMICYCKRISSEICKQKEQSQDNSQKEIILNVYQEKCTGILAEIHNLDPEAFSFVILTNILQKISQLVLDFTYVEECCLVDQDFLLQAAYERVTYIIESLSSIESLSRDVAPDSNPRDMLSPSGAECIHWRKGALLYMYCHTVNSRCSREQLPQHFLQCLQDGSKYLVAMLSTRSSPLWLNMASDAVAEPDMAGSGSAGDTGDMLLSQGIYSDTHLLALMYLGEMCFWYAQLTQPIPELGDSGSLTQQAASAGDKQPFPDGASTDGKNPDVSHSSSSLGEAKLKRSSSLQQGQSLDMLRVGQLCLENYVTAAKGPMSAGGWNTDRAEEILQYFGSLSI